MLVGDHSMAPRSRARSDAGPRIRLLCTFNPRLTATIAAARRERRNCLDQLERKLIKNAVHLPALPKVERFVGIAVV